MLLRRLCNAVPVRVRAALVIGATLFAAALFGAHTAYAHETAPRYNQVDLQTQVMREVDNDLIRATMYAERQESDPAALQNALNKIAAEAHAAARDFTTVKTTTGRNNTYPVYDRNNRLIAWRGRSEVRLESKDFPAVAKLIARLQSSMQLGNVSFSVSPELRRQVEQEMLQEAVDSFRERAGILTRALGGKSYRLRQLSVHTSGGSPVQPMMARAAKADAAESYAPVLEGGTSHINVGATGSIEVVE